MRLPIHRCVARVAASLALAGASAQAETPDSLICGRVYVSAQLPEPVVCL